MRVQLDKILIAGLLLLIGVNLQAQSQSSKSDTTAFEIKKIAESDITLLFSYYEQDGNNSAVTGGLGTERLTDVTSKIIVNIAMDDKSTVSFDGGFDYYTSASTDNIDDFISSASSKDMRVHANLGYSRKAKDDVTWGLKLGGSTEYDYNSLQFSGYVSKISRDGNRTYGLAAQAFIDKWEIIYPRELRTQQWVTTDQRRSYSVSASFSTVINKRMQASVSTDIVTQSGLLGTPFHRVYFSDQVGAKVERLPFTRLKIPIGFRLNYYVNDFLLLRSYYRFYWDDWGVKGHTLGLEAPIKLNRFFSIYPFYRFHTQSAANYFKPFGQHTNEFQYYTSDFDLSNLSSHQYGMGVRYSPADGIGAFRLPGRNKRLLTLKEISLKYGHYTRSPNLVSNIFSFGMNFSF